MREIEEVGKEEHATSPPSMINKVTVGLFRPPHLWPLNSSRALFPGGYPSPPQQHPPPPPLPVGGTLEHLIQGLFTRSVLFGGGKIIDYVRVVGCELRG